MKSLFGKKTSLTMDLYLPAFVLALVMAYVLTAVPIGAVARALLSRCNCCSITTND